jgi:DNA-binding LacI/PurR family transcriptional regulator
MTHARFGVISQTVRSATQFNSTNRNEATRMKKHTSSIAKDSKAVTLKAVAEYVGLAAGTVSMVLNHAPDYIPQHTQDRVFAAVRKLNYRPNPFARALRTKQIPGVRGTPTLGTGSRALVFEGAEDFLLAVNAIRQAGLRVPGDVSVVGGSEI